ncbi:MAG: NAD(P)-binding domain-containing protein [Methyloceanibacter sp.]|uniref:NAD(P)-binding domain-containing protein n=1 Tax=Methyloceanibacter sp. TaxID=1965321 RepID=UPI003D9AFFAB
MPSHVYGARDPKRSQERNATSVSDALAVAEVLILATPWPVMESLICEQAWSLDGKIVIDVTNPIAANLAGLAIGFDSSGAELLQSQAHEAKFFKAFTPSGWMSWPSRASRKGVQPCSSPAPMGRRSSW